MRRLHVVGAGAALCGLAVGGFAGVRAEQPVATSPAAAPPRVTVDLQLGRPQVVVPACEAGTRARLVVMGQCAAIEPSEFASACASVAAWLPDARPALAQTEGMTVVVRFVQGEPTR